MGYPVVGDRSLGAAETCVCGGTERVGRQMDGMVCLGLGSRRGGVEGARKRSRGTAGRGATPDARPAMSGTVTAEVGGVREGGGCVTRAGRGAGWVWRGFGRVYVVPLIRGEEEVVVVDLREVLHSTAFALFLPLCSSAQRND